MEKPTTSAYIHQRLICQAFFTVIYLAKSINITTEQPLPSTPLAFSCSNAVEIYAHSIFFATEQRQLIHQNYGFATITQFTISGLFPKQPAPSSGCIFKWYMYI
jgi:hypothetical protein